MSELTVLQETYPGEDGWRDYVDVFRASWPARNSDRFYPEHCPDEEIAIVVTALLEEHAADWFAKPIPALGNRSAADVLKNEPFGTQIIRHLLMRLPQ